MVRFKSITKIAKSRSCCQASKNGPCNRAQIIVGDMPVSPLSIRIPLYVGIVHLTSDGRLACRRQQQKIQQQQPQQQTNRQNNVYSSITMN